MALSFPYTLGSFCDLLRLSTSQPFLQRFEERSGSGDSRIWAVEMARPLWMAKGQMADRNAAMARELEGKIDGLEGSTKTFLYADPSYSGPASGVTSGLGSATISSIRADRGAIGITGLPGSFTATAGDFLSVKYGSRYYFGRFVETLTAGSSGSMSQIEIRPYLSLGVSTSDPVELSRPRFMAKIAVNGYEPFTYDRPNGEIARGGSITIVQKI